MVKKGFWKEYKEKNYLELILISLIIFSLSIFGIYFYYNTDNSTEFNGQISTEFNGQISTEFNGQIDNIQMCENKTLEDTTECLVDYVKTFYNYTVRDDTEKNLSDIKVNGGDCYDWSKNVYEPLAKSLEFYADTKPIFTENEGHRFAIIWDKNLTNYCIIDQRSYWCEELQ